MDTVHDDQAEDALAALVGSPETAARAIDELSARGFSDAEIGVAARDVEVQQRLSALPAASEARGRVAVALDRGEVDYLADLFVRAGYPESSRRAEDFYARFEGGEVLLTVRAGRRIGAVHEMLSALPGDPIIIAGD